MPAVSKAQQRFMGMVYATKKGDMTNPSPEVAQAAASMKKSDAKDFASTKHKKLPEKKVAKEAADFECSIIGGKANNWLSARKIYKSCMKTKGY